VSIPLRAASELAWTLRANVFGLLPLHVGIRQYWRDFDALERWVRSQPLAGEELAHPHSPNRSSTAEARPSVCFA
jgi:hypothetical protein